MTVRITALTRAVPPMVAETLADALLCAANAALVLDINLGGLALGIQKVESE